MKSSFIFCFLPLTLAANVVVTVLKEGNQIFHPETVQAAIGDNIVFSFQKGSYKIHQSTFESPCTPHANGNSISSTVQRDVSDPVDDKESKRELLSRVNSRRESLVTALMVQNTDPISFYDERNGLCNQGAILVVNPSAAQSVAQFKANAVKAPASSPNPTSPTQQPPNSPTSPTQQQKNSGSREAASVLTIFLSLLVAAL